MRRGNGGEPDVGDREDVRPAPGKEGPDCSESLRVADQSIDGMSLAWVECDGTADEKTVSRAHIFDLSTMIDRPLGPFEGRPFQVDLSPSGDRLVVRRMGGDAVPAIVLDAGGPPQSLEQGWTPLGWSGRNRVILEDHVNGAKRLAVADVETGDLRQIYPAIDPAE